MEEKFLLFYLTSQCGSQTSTDHWRSCRLLRLASIRYIQFSFQNTAAREHDRAYQHIKSNQNENNNSSVN